MKVSVEREEYRPVTAVFEMEWEIDIVLYSLDKVSKSSESLVQTKANARALYRELSRVYK